MLSDRFRIRKFTKGLSSLIPFRSLANQCDHAVVLAGTFSYGKILYGRKIGFRLYQPSMKIYYHLE